MCYTDGSKTNTGTGCGYIIHEAKNLTDTTTNSSALPNYCTVCQAELTAITMAANNINSSIKPNQKVHIFTDSQASINSIMDTKIRSQTSLDCHKALHNLANSNEVNISWIPGHSGFWGNEEADKLANAGTEHDTPLNGHLPFSYIKSKISNKIKEQHNKEWIQHGNNRSKLLATDKHIKHFNRLKRNDMRIAI